MPSSELFCSLPEPFSSCPWLSQALCLSPGSSLLYPLVHHFSRCGHAVGDTECLSALGEIKNQQVCPLGLVSKRKRWQSRRVSGAWKAPLALEGASLPHCTLIYTSMSPKSLNTPDFLQCILVPLPTLAAIWLPEIRAADIKMFITNL